MITLIVNVTVKPELVEDFIKETTFASHKSLEETGCSQYDILRNNDTSNHIVLVETYDNQEAIDYHRETSHFKQWRMNVEEMMLLPRIARKYTKII